MVQKLILKNFQRHKKLVLEFDPHITTIVGATDRGKSAIIRALRWVMTNQPRGDAFIKHGADHTYVTLHVDGHVIKRERFASGNFYRLDGQEYQAFGSGVPDEVLKVLNTDDVSWQGQLDAPFLFSLSSGDIARELNRVVALDLIDSSLANIASEVRRATDSVKVSQERLAHAEERRQELAWVEQADKDIRELEDVWKRVEAAQQEIDDLTALITEAETLQSGLDGEQQTIITMQALIAAGEKVLVAQRDIDGLQTLLDEADQYQQEVNDLEQKVGRLTEELREQAGDRCPLCGLEGGELL